MKVRQVNRLNFYNLKGELKRVRRKINYGRVLASRRICSRYFYVCDHAHVCLHICTCFIKMSHTYFSIL